MKDILFEIYKDKRTIFRLTDVAMLQPQMENTYLSNRLNYYVRTGKLLRLRRGIFAKPDYNPEELACMLYAPSYLSLEYVLQRAGVIFQFDSRYTIVSYLNRELEVDGKTFRFRKIKGECFIDRKGIILRDNVNIATPERAFLDLLYLNKDFYFDNLHTLDKATVYEILPSYNSVALTQRVHKLLIDG
ncbi:hypothetical protein LJC72_00895 [Bacteroides sp. OttesenSCG-928-D19]|nr:hypothetical protein [Bacteroides sp. OttesenSCG-928-D19]